MSRVAAAALLLALPAAAHGADGRPNVVLVIGDDMAWSDHGFRGHHAIQTPRLDALADESAVFRGYVSAPLCRPSLASIATGLPVHAHGISGNDPPAGTAREGMLPLLAACDTLPALLAGSGYRTLQTGKWWEGGHAQGGFTDGMTHGDPARGGRHGDLGLSIGREGLGPIEAFVDACTAEGAPFLVWYAPFLPHRPHDPPERLLARYRDRAPSPHVARYWAMCAWFDESVGALLDLLEARGVADDTLLVFLNDNGWIQREQAQGYDPRSKRSPYEGGVRTPVLVRWPGRVPPGPAPGLASAVDLAPTVLRACGAAVPAAMRGADLVAVAGGRARPRGAAFGAAYRHDVVRIGDPAAGLLSRWVATERWKLIVHTEGGAELFDLAADPHESADLAAARPGDVARLRARLDGWWPGS